MRLRRIRVGVLFGGRSGEHEVSLASARSVVRALDPVKYEAVPIRITREGRWLIADSPAALLNSEVTSGLPDTYEAVPDVSHQAIVRVGRGGAGGHETSVDVVFPLLHGPYGEDGTVQGLLELANIPYVGAGVLSSAVSMDKAFMKVQLGHAGLPQVRHHLVKAHDWDRDRLGSVNAVECDLTYPMFVKPCNLGSSVGISKACSASDLRDAIDLAIRYDNRVLVEQGVDAREIECSVLGNQDPIVSVPGEVRSRHDWYDYEAKYTDGLAELVIPAEVTEEQADTARDYARRAFLAVNAEGLARVDFFVLRTTGEVLVNEINTMPGFTETSMYPKLWEASGISYPELVDRLIDLAFERHALRQGRSDTR
jgi:D-alanine-D-alanine ligase